MVDYAQSPCGGSTKPRFLQPFANMVAGGLSVELGGETVGVKERGNALNDGALALSVRNSANLRVARRKDRMSQQLGVAPGRARQNTVKCFDSLSVPV